MRTTFFGMLLCCSCTLTVGHPPESSRVTEAETRAEIATESCQGQADDLARALGDLNRFVGQVIPLKVGKAVNRVLIRTGYPEFASVPVAPAPRPSATPAEPKPEAPKP